MTTIYHCVIDPIIIASHRSDSIYTHGSISSIYLR